jgi:hypothetical protein
MRNQIAFRTQLGTPGHLKIQVGMISVGMQNCCDARLTNRAIFNRCFNNNSNGERPGPDYGVIAAGAPPILPSQ